MATIIGQVTIPDYVITGISGASEIQATGLPTNGSVILACLVNNPGVWQMAGCDRQMIVFVGGSSLSSELRSLVENGVTNHNSIYPPSGWSYVG